MAENDDPTPGSDETASAPAEETVEQTAVTSSAPATAPATTPAQVKFTDRVWNFRAMVAVALAALLLGGGMGAAIAAVSQDDNQDRHPGFMRWQGDPGGPGGPGGPFMGPGPNGFGPGERQQFRQDLKDLRKKLHEQMKKQLQDNEDAPTPTAPPTPSSSSNG